MAAVTRVGWRAELPPVPVARARRLLACVFFAGLGFPTCFAGTRFARTRPRRFGARGGLERRAMRAQSGGAGKMVGQAGEQSAPIARAERCLDMVLRVRHYPQYVSVVAEDARDRIGRPIDVPVGMERAVRRGVAKQHPSLLLEAIDRVGIRDVIPLAMGNGYANHLPGIVAAGEGSFGMLDTQKNVAANKLQCRVAHQSARQKPRLA